MSAWRPSRGAIAAAASLAVAAAAVAVAPSRWGLNFFHAFLLGGALYAGALRRHFARGSEGTAAILWRGALVRAAAFLLFAGTQAIVCFDLAPDADMRGFFVILSSWIVAETALG